MGPDLVSGHLPICQQIQQGVDKIVSECLAAVREGSRAPGIIGQDLRQLTYYFLRFVW